MWECELDYYRMDVAIHSTEGQWLTEWKSGLQKHFKFILIFIYNLFSFVSFIFVYHREDPRRTEKERRAIPDICHFWYATIIFRPVKGTPKKCVNSRQKFPRDKTA